jgi:hypothetical protein
VFPYKGDWTAPFAPPIDQTVGVYNNVQPGEWFYAGIWIDHGGANRDIGAKISDDASGNSLSYDDQTDVLDNEDIYYPEDQENLARFAAIPKTPFAFAAMNTSYVFAYGGGWSIRWDPAVLMTNDGMKGSAGWWGSGGDTFQTQGGSGTWMYTINEDPVDPYDGQTSVDTEFPSNFYNRVVGSTIISYTWTAGVYPTMPDGVDDYGDYSLPANIVQGDHMVARIALKPVGNSGEGSRLSFEFGAQNVVWVAKGDKSNNTATFANNAISPLWPTWPDNCSLGSASKGMVNEQLSWVCIQ